MTVEPSDAERLRGRAPVGGRPVMRQVWRHLGFLHWPVAAADVARLLPPGLQVDTWDGVAYLGIVPFTIPLSRTPRLGLPIAPAFHEVNLRTYVHRSGRDPGVWFFSLEAASRLAVAGARLGYGLPYFHARMSMAVTGEGEGQGKGEPPTIAYESRRTSGGGDRPFFRGSYGPTGTAAGAPVPAPAPPGTLEFFLVERYQLYAWNGRALRSARVYHVPYAIQPAATDGVSETLTVAAGLPATVGPPALAHYAREVDVRIYRPRSVDSPSPA